MSNIPHFENDLNAAMMYKGLHPECFLIVSLEDSSSTNFDDFWSNSVIILNLNKMHIITRLSESKNPEGYNQFLNLFKITNVPSIVIFGQNTTNISKIFYPFPDPTTLTSYFSQAPSVPASPQQDFPAPPPMDEYLAHPQESQQSQQSQESQQSQQPIQQPKQSRQQAEQPQRQPKTTTKISIQTPSGRSFTHVFEKTNTVGDLKNWIESEFGSDVFSDLVIAHTNTPLPDDNSLSLENADLSPSAVLKLLNDDSILDIHVEDGQDDVPSERIRRHCCKCRCHCLPCTCFNSRAFRWFRIIFSLLNPWGDDPGPNSHDDPNGDNDIWQYRPNPQLTQNIRNALNMQRGNGGDPNRFTQA